MTVFWNVINYFVIFLRNLSLPNWVRRWMLY